MSAGDLRFRRRHRRGKKIVAEKSIEIVVHALTVQSKVAPQRGLAQESQALENALRRNVADRTPRFEPLDSDRDEELRQEQRESLAHDSAPLRARCKRVADLRQGVFPGDDGKGDPTRGLAILEHDPLKAFALAAIEILHTLPGEIGTQVGHCRALQRLIASHRGLGTPAIHLRRIARERRSDRDAPAERSALGRHRHHVHDPSATIPAVGDDFAIDDCGTAPYRCRMTVAYQGGAYAGWQRQANAFTVQEALENALSAQTGERIIVTAAGRTDAGVHAAGQVVHFDLRRPVPASALVHGTNRLLPDDIRVLRAEPVAPSFHARFDAVAKSYRYRLYRGRFVPPSDAPFAAPVRDDIDFDRLRTATLHLPGRHDFRAFALAGGAHKTTERTIFSAGWRDASPILELTIVGDGFLRGMVRSLVGTLLEVGFGKRKSGELVRLLTGADRSAAGPTAPAQGLSLERIDYPESSAPEALW